MLSKAQLSQFFRKKSLKFLKQSPFIKNFVYTLYYTKRSSLLGSKNILVCEAYNHTDPNIDTCTLTGLRGANIDTTHDFFVTNYEPNPNDVIIPTDRENIYSFIGRENSKYNLLFKHFVSNILIFS